MTESPAAPGGAPDPLDATRRWVERAVIGLNLCPFAKAVYVKQQVRFVLSDASTPEALLEELAEELVLLRDADPEQGCRGSKAGRQDDGPAERLRSAGGDRRTLAGHGRSDPVRATCPHQDPHP